MSIIDTCDHIFLFFSAIGHVVLFVVPLLRYTRLSDYSDFRPRVNIVIKQNVLFVYGAFDIILIPSVHYFVLHHLYISQSSMFSCYIHLDNVYFIHVKIFVFMLGWCIFYIILSIWNGFTFQIYKIELYDSVRGSNCCWLHSSVRAVVHYKV